MLRKHCRSSTRAVHTCMGPIHGVHTCMYDALLGPNILGYNLPRWDHMVCICQNLDVDNATTWTFSQPWRHPIDYVFVSWYFYGQGAAKCSSIEMLPEAPIGWKHKASYVVWCWIRVCCSAGLWQHGHLQLAPSAKEIPWCRHRLGYLTDFEPTRNIAVIIM